MTYEVGSIIETGKSTKKSMYGFWNKRFIVISNNGFNTYSGCLTCVEVINREWKNKNHLIFKTPFFKAIICERIYSVPQSIILKDYGLVSKEILKNIKCFVFNILQKESQFSSTKLNQGDVFVLKKECTDKPIEYIQTLYNRPLVCLAAIKNTIIYVPLSTKIHKTHDSHVLVKENLNQPSIALCEQVQSLSFDFINNQDFKVVSNVKNDLDHIKNVFFTRQLA